MIVLPCIGSQDQTTFNPSFLTALINFGRNSSALLAPNLEIKVSLPASLSGFKILESLLNLYQTFDEFNQRVSTQQDIIIDQHGQEKMVHQLYLGVARGWYVTLDGTAAYGGIPTANGWQWQYDIPVSPQIIKDALAMLAHKKEAHLITLPMSLTSLETVGQ